MEANAEQVAQKARSLQTYIIGIDFDGTITDSNIFPRIGELRPGIKEFLCRLKSEGHDIILTTCRHGTYLTEAIQYLRKNGLACVFSGYNVQSRYSVPGISGKLYCHFLIDDCATPGEFNLNAWIKYFEKTGVLSPAKKRGRPSKNRR